MELDVTVSVENELLIVVELEPTIIVELVVTVELMKADEVEAKVRLVVTGVELIAGEDISGVGDELIIRDVVSGVELRLLVGSVELSIEEVVDGSEVVIGAGITVVKINNIIVEHNLYTFTTGLCSAPVTISVTDPFIRSHYLKSFGT